MEMIRQVHGVKREQTPRPERGEIIDAINSDSYSDVEELLERGMNPNERIGSGNTALMLAVRAGPESMRALLKGGANPNLTNTRGETALMMAVQMGTEETIDLLLDAGANVNVHDQFGNTPLTRAMERGHSASVIQKLLRAGANPDNHPPNKSPPLLRSVLNNPEYIMPLLNAGADVDIMDETQTTPLMYLLRGNFDLDVALKMISMSKNINAKNPSGDSALVFAATNRIVENADKIKPVLQALMMGAKADATVLMNYKDRFNKAAKDYFLKSGYHDEVMAQSSEWDISSQDLESSEADGVADVEHKFDERGNWVPQIGEKVQWSYSGKQDEKSKSGYERDTYIHKNIDEAKFGIIKEFRQGAGLSKGSVTMFIAEVESKKVKEIDYMLDRIEPVWENETGKIFTFRKIFPRDKWRVNPYDPSIQYTRHVYEKKPF